MATHWTLKLEQIFASYMGTISTTTIPATVLKTGARATTDRTRPAVVTHVTSTRLGQNMLDVTVSLHTLTNAKDTTDDQAAEWSQAATDFFMDTAAWSAWTATQTTTYRTGWAIGKRWLGDLDIETDDTEQTRDYTQEIGVIVALFDNV